MITDLKLRQLEIFAEVARRESVGGAARALRLSQPAVSRTLRELETICGKTLIEKRGRGIGLTVFGRTLQAYATTSVNAARQGLAVLKGQDAATAQLRIGALPSVAGHLMPAVIHAFRTLHPEVALSIVTGENRSLLDQLRNNILDLVIGRLPAKEAMLGLRFEPLYLEKVVAVVRPGHPIANQSTLNQSVLQDWPILVPGKGSIIRPMIDRYFYEVGARLPNTAIETVAEAFCRSYVHDHQAVWFISHGVVQRDIAAKGLCALPLDTMTTQGPVGICLRADGEQHKAVQLLEEVIRSEIEPHTLQ